MQNQDYSSTHFGYEKVHPKEKTRKVAGVFHSVAEKYDIMNDLMSFGIHRIWKRIAVDLANIRNGDKVLDLASGTGDLTARMAPLVGDKGRICSSDINSSMLEKGKENLLNKGIYQNIDYVLADAEELPFADNTFNKVIIGFGIRNVTHIEKALASMCRVLKPGGRAIILEFSQPNVPLVKPIYDAFSFSVLPLLGKLIAGDSASYKYLHESIRMHPDQQAMANLLVSAGFDESDYHNLTAGIVAVHRGFKY